MASDDAKKESDTQNAGVHVLLVGDAEFVESTATGLARASDEIAVVTETSVEVAAGRLDDGRFDCVVSEYHLPNGDGVAFLRLVRERRPALPFVMFTRESGDEILSAALDAGVTEFLRRTAGPAQYELLARRVVDATAGSPATREGGAGAEQREIANPSSLLDSLFERIPVHLYVKDREGRHLRISRVFLEDIGSDPADIIGRTDLDLVAAGLTREAFARESYQDDIRVVETGDAVLDKEEYNPEIDRWLVTSKVPWHDENGTVVGLIGVTRDITARRRREQQVEALHEATRDLMQTDSRTAVAELTLAAAEETLGYQMSVVRLLSADGTRLELVAQTDAVRERLGERPDYPVGEGLAGEAFEVGAPVVVDDVRERDDGYDRGAARAVMAIPIGTHGALTIATDESGVLDEHDVRIAGILATNAGTVLDRLEQQQELERQNQRLDEFASLVSHDLRNPLNVAVGNLELARRDCENDHLDRVADAHRRIDDLIESVLTLARGGQIVEDTEPLDLTELAANCWAAVSGDRGELRIQDDVVIQGDRDRTRQILENLVRNAVEHAGPNATVRIGTVVDESGVGVYVEDDGPGIPEDERDHVFQSGYSTADDSTGFGLAIVKELVEAHGWRIHVTESDSGGARFEITGVKLG